MKRNISFWYFSENHVEAYKKSVLQYLENYLNEFEKISSLSIVMDFHNGDKIKNKSPTNHLFLCDLGEDSNKLEEVCKYVLSRDRSFVPLSVSCHNKADYEMVEKILRENYGEEGKLTNGFLGIGRLTNLKNIKGRTPKEMPFGNYVCR